MRISAVRLILSGVLIAVAAAPVVVAQSTNRPTASPASAPSLADDRKATPQITLGTTSADPGDTATVPITFKPGQGTGIRSLKLTVVFRSTILKFDRLVRGPNADAKKMEVTLEDHVTSGEGRDEYSTLIIRAVVPPGEPEQSGLPSGVLGNMVFRVDPDSDGAIVDLNTTVEATESGSVSPLPTQKVRVTDGEVFVTAPGGVPGCFFFTH